MNRCFEDIPAMHCEIQVQSHHLGRKFYMQEHKGPCGLINGFLRKKLNTEHHFL